MTDMTTLVDATARAQFANDCPTRSFDALSQLEQYAYRMAVAPIVAAVAPLIERDARAAALEEAADEIKRERRWQTERAQRNQPAEPITVRLGVVEGILRDRAQAIRDGR